MRTLHLYFARELVKTFLMTSLTLTLLVVMGGGVANIFKGEGIGAEEVAKVFAFLTPVAVTLILPVAALFSATICYGRAAADNEITACRAAGINVQRLLLSAGALGLLITFVTYLSWNFMIPRLLQQIEDTTKQDLHVIVLSQFQKAKPLVFGKYRLMANRCEPVSPEDVPPEKRADHTYLHLIGVTFLEMEDQEVVRFGTAETTVVEFDRQERTPRVKADLQNVRSYDSSRRQYYEFQHQVLGPFEIPMPFRRKIKFENLPALLEYQKSPERIPDVESRVVGLKRTIMNYLLFDDIIHQLDPARAGQHKYLLTGDKVQFEISADQFKIDPENGKPTLGAVRIEERSSVDNSRRIYQADTTVFELRSGIRADSPVIFTELRGNVTARRVPYVEGERVVKKDAVTLPAVEFLAQDRLKSRFDSLDITGLLMGTANLEMPPDQSRQLAKLGERVGQIEGEVTGEIHFRASYAVSVVAMILLGATLGIIVRGGQVLTAFGISCIPTLIVVVACIVGRNLADRPHMTWVSLLVMWGAAALMYAGWGFIATRVLKT